MRLSEWRAAAPAKDAASPKVGAVVDPVLAALGAGPDPHGWIAWGDEPATKFTVFVPTQPGLIACFVRVNVPGDGPRASTKLIRWNRVSVGELGVETQAGHRMLSFQLEGQILRGVDAEADRAAAFAIRVIAATDGRPLPEVDEGPGSRKDGPPRPAKAPAAAAAKGTGPANGSGASAKSGERAAAATKRPGGVPGDSRAGADH